MSFKQTFTIICILLITISTSAQVPNTINYQGRLTDASGSPVADGAYLVKFIIYDAPTAGTDLWNTGFQTINTVDGLFSYQLGSNVVLPNGIFSDTSRYLGLTVGTDPELTPRSRFISSSYAFEAGNVAWSNISSVPAGFADGVDDEGLSQATADAAYINATGDDMTGSLNIYNGGILRIEASGFYGGLRTFGTDALIRTRLYSNFWGQLLLYDNTTNNTVQLNANYSDGGSLLLIDPTGTEDITLSARETGNSTVIFPNNAIDNTEILDEPGIAGRLNSTSTITLNQTTTTMTDLITVTITIPSVGYIYVTGHTLQYISGTTATNVGIYQIDETSGGGEISNYYTWAGFNSSPNTNTFYQSVDVNRVFFKSAGTYTFRLEGLARSSNGSAAITKCYGSKIIAMYFPTSYGTVTAVSPQPPTGTEATLVQSTNLDGSAEQVYEYDLRDLELKAKEAQLKAQQAEMELLKAQQRQNSNQQ